jgi:peptidylprolyl isomerase
MLVFDIELLSVTPAIDVTPPGDLNMPPPEAKRTSSLLVYRVLSPGTGTHPPGPRDKIKIHYSGWTADGELFDSTRHRGRPAILDVDKMIPGWSEAVQLMVKGQRNRIWIPSHLAYGSRPSIPGAPAGRLVIDVELVDIGRVRGAS